jgi:isopentenyl diphosphate isomerase/L-lactate dehydrogenase-like FMN-dependent dehydrogenase
MSEPLNLREFEALARARMEPGAFAYYAGGAGDEHTLRENEAAFARRRLRPRVLVDVSDIDTGVTLLGERVTMPVGVAPTAQHRFAHLDGEAATARAAAQAGVLFCASTSSSLSLEEIADAAEPLRWFQMYTQDNAGPLTEALLRRAEAAGYRAIVLTVDLAVSGLRERDLREKIDISAVMHGNFPPEDRETEGALIAPRRDVHVPTAFSWRDVAWLRARTSLPIVLKGILTAEDARLAVEHGAAAVWVSNHGGRQLDRSPATIDVLEEIADAVAGRAEVYVDGGVRRGIDVATALALGARAVFLGRPVLWALAADGEAGVRRALSMIDAELRNAMALLGTPTVAEITRAHVT